MGIATIVSTTNTEEIENQIQIFTSKSNFNINKQSPDLFIVDLEKKLSIGIDQTKELINWSYIKPYNNISKLAIIYHASNLTEQAQNSLLKLLEEPPQALNIILIVNNYRDLLPTIISRCHLIHLDQTDQMISNDFTILNKKDQLLFVRKLIDQKKKDNSIQQIRDFLKNLLYYYREALLKNVNIDSVKHNIILIQETDKMLRASVLPKLALENLVINLN